jgi:hypothetical protein
VALALGLTAHPNTQQHERCGGQEITAKQFRPFSAKVWQLDRWRRGWPKDSTVDAYQRKLLCAAGPGHRQAMQNRWSRDRGRYDRHRHHERYCRSGYIVRGRVSVFGGGLTASGLIASSTPGLALNIDPGDEPDGWNNSTTAAWIARRQLFHVEILGHGADLPVIDAGPASWTGRSIDVTEPGASALGLSISAFPTDSVGTARLIPFGCG